MTTDTLYIVGGKIFHRKLAFAFTAAHLVFQGLAKLLHNHITSSIISLIKSHY